MQVVEMQITDPEFPEGTVFHGAEVHPGFWIGTVTYANDGHADLDAALTIENGTVIKVKRLEKEISQIRLVTQRASSRFRIDRGNKRRVAEHQAQDQLRQERREEAAATRAK